MDKAHGKLITDSKALDSLILNYTWGWIRTNTIYTFGNIPLGKNKQVNNSVHRKI